MEISELSDFMKRRLIFELDNIKSHILARSMFNNEPYIVWPIYKCTLTNREFTRYCLEMVRTLRFKDGYEVFKVEAKLKDVLVLRIKYDA